MSKPEWGVKRGCTACDTRFYDMRRTPIHCPKCGALVAATPPRNERPSAASRANAREARNSAAAAARADAQRFGWSPEIRPPNAAEAEAEVEVEEPAEDVEAELEDGDDREVEPDDDKPGETGAAP